MKPKKSANIRKKITRKSAAETLKTLSVFQQTEDYLKSVLSPFERHILLTQRILLWEVPSLSVVVLFVLHFIFWAAARLQLITLYGIIGILVVIADSVINYKYKGRRQTEDNLDRFTELHSDYLGVPELSYLLADKWILCSEWIAKIRSFRAHNHIKFNILCSGVFFVLYLIGSRVSGLYLSYFIVVSVYFMPLLRKHNVLQAITNTSSECLFKLERACHIKRPSQVGRGRCDSLMDGAQSTDSEIDMDQYLPDTEEKQPVETLTSGDIIPSSDESTGHTPQVSTPGRLYDESDDDILNSDMASLVSGLGDMPSISAVDGAMSSDFSQNTSLNSIPSSSPNISTDQVSDETRFVSEHFGDITLEDEDHLAEGLDFSGVQLDNDRPPERSSASGIDIVSAFSTASALISSPEAARMVSGIVASTVSTLSNLHRTVSSSGDTSAAPEDISSRSARPLSSDLDAIDTEFEFLDKEELAQQDDL